MEEKRTAVKVVVLIESGEPHGSRENYLRVFGSIPNTEILCVLDEESLASPGRLESLLPDFAILSVTRKSVAERMKIKLARILPRCRAFVHVEHALSEAESLTLRSEIANIAQGNRDQATGSIQLQGNGSVEDLYDYVAYVSALSEEKVCSRIAYNSVERRRFRAGRRRHEVGRLAPVARFQSFVEQLPGVPYIAALDSPNNIIYVSPRIEELLGFTPTKWCRDPLMRQCQLHPDDRPLVEMAIRNAIEKNGSYRLDYRIFHCNRTLRWVHDEARVMTDSSGAPLFLQGAFMDITERKETQEELELSHAELQKLLDRLELLRYEEQKRLAHEMHDDFGQLLAAMKLDLSVLQQRLSDRDADTTQYLHNINELVDAMVTSVRRILSDLPPKAVEDLGLPCALQSMARTFENRYRIRCRLQVCGIGEELDMRVGMALYRTVQEALNNAAKHAEANAVDVDLRCKGGFVCLTTRDDGKGIPDVSRWRDGAFGLTGMRQRVITLGGNMCINGTPGQGTLIAIDIPLPSIPARENRTETEQRH